MGKICGRERVRSPFLGGGAARRGGGGRRSGAGQDFGCDWGIMAKDKQQNMAQEAHRITLQRTITCLPCLPYVLPTAGAP